jgi:hypothetical protein
VSTRHRQTRPGAAHRVAPSRAERTGSNRRARHSTAAELRSVRKGADPEDLADTLPVHTAARYVPDEEPAPVAPSRRARHWKMPFWKRRSNDRRARAAAMAALAD